jgi:asparagine synthase (glutamine-hydrolysing)
MCGIAGIVGPQSDRVGRTWLEETLAALHHRGPDGSGLWSDEDAALGHTRLAIRDLSDAASQPMRSISGRSLITYNGELYGYDATERTLCESGLRLRTSSDTEILLEALDRWGADGLTRFNGMFAVGFWHAGERTLTLARDPVGIKPLYFAKLGESLAFCSELRPLVSLPGLDRRLDHDALHLGLILGVIPAPWTLVRGIRQLLPGHALRWRDGQVRMHRFARPIGEPDPDLVERLASSSEERERALEELLDEAVRDQLVSDVPLGVLLSGGVDSSLIASFAAARVQRVKTFSVIHANPAYDERDEARAVSRHLGTDHVELELPEEGLSEAEFLGLVDHHGDPFADSSSLPTRRLAREVRRHVTVALSGDGGDELFAGYPRYRIASMLDALARAPHWLTRSVGHAAATLAGVTPGRGRQLFRRGSRALLASARPPHERAFATRTWFWGDELARVLLPTVQTKANPLRDLVKQRAVAGYPPERPEGCHRLEQHVVLPDDMLTKVDRMTMAESLEIRPPLLDLRVTAYAAALPFQDKIAHGEGKAILKRIARRRVPSWVIDRPKKGFALPLLDFGGDLLADQTHEILAAPSSPLRALFTPAALAAFGLEFHRRGDGALPEDSAYRRMHRQWLLVLLARAIERLGVEV